MKKIIHAALIGAAVFALTSAAKAEGVMFTSKTDLGNVIGLMDQRTPECTRMGSGYKLATVVIKKTSQVRRGCWQVIAGADTVHVQWTDGAEYQYDISMFSVTDYFTENYDNKGSKTTGKSL